MIMTEKKFAGRVMLTGFLLTLALTVLARICGIVYSYFATDILYSESAFLPYLPIIKSILSCAAYGAAVGTVVALTGRRRSGAIGLYAIVLVADSAAAFVFDLLSGVLRGRVLFAVLYAVMKAAMPLLCILLGLLISRKLIRDGRIPRAAVVVSLVYPVLSLVELMRAVISYLIEVDRLDRDRSCGSRGIVCHVGGNFIFSVPELHPERSKLSLRVGRGCAK